MSQDAFLTTATPGAVAADLLVVGVLEGGEPPADGLPEPVRQAVRTLAGRAGFAARDKQRVETTVDGADVGAVALCGLGKVEELTARKLAGMLAGEAERARVNGIGRLGLLLPEHAETRGEEAALRVARSAALARYRYDRFMSEPRRTPPSLSGVVLVAPAERQAELDRALPTARALAEGIAFARDLANTPGNVADPAWMEQQAREMAEGRGIACTVLGKSELEQRGMGGILAVGAGSAVPPRLLRLEWGEGEQTVSLVGKGVTFDTGGISIKPAPDMNDMKYDKSGACAVLGVAHAVSALELPLRLRVYVPLAENMPDGAAYRPGDIIRCYNGKTVEIMNTDAEGRMILADALALAVEEGSDAVLEMSTLTGASVIALGFTAAALYTPDDELARALLQAAEASGERLWRMPLWPEYTEAMRGVHADLKNAGGRWGSANTAAAFLGQFVGDHRHWAHVDLAGPAFISHDAEEPKGATGYGVATTVDWLRRRVAS